MYIGCRVQAAVVAGRCGHTLPHCRCDWAVWLGGAATRSLVWLGGAATRSLLWLGGSATLQVWLGGAATRSHNGPAAPLSGEGARRRIEAAAAPVSVAVPN